jgi:hypothetical protein
VCASVPLRENPFFQLFEEDDEVGHMRLSAQIHRRQVVKETEE